MWFGFCGDSCYVYELSEDYFKLEKCGIKLRGRSAHIMISIEPVWVHIVVYILFSLYLRG